MLLIHRYVKSPHADICQDKINIQVYIRFF